MVAPDLTREFSGLELTKDLFPVGTQILWKYKDFNEYRSGTISHWYEDLCCLTIVGDDTLVPPYFISFDDVVLKAVNGKPQTSLENPHPHYRWKQGDQLIIRQMNYPLATFPVEISRYVYGNSTVTFRHLEGDCELEEMAVDDVSVVAVIAQVSDYRPDPSTHPLGTTMVVIIEKGGHLTPPQTLTIKQWYTNTSSGKKSLKFLGQDRWYGVEQIHIQKILGNIQDPDRSDNSPPPSDVVTVNPFDHPVGTVLVVKGLPCDDDRVRRLGETQVKILAWDLATATVVEVRTVHGYPLFHDSEMDSANIIAKNLEVIKILHYEAPPVSQSDSAKRCPSTDHVGRDLVVAINEIKELARLSGLEVSVILG